VEQRVQIQKDWKFRFYYCHGTGSSHIHYETSRHSHQLAHIACCLANWTVAYYRLRIRIFKNFKNVNLNFITFKLSPLPSSNKVFVANTAVITSGLKILWCQQFKIRWLVNSSARSYEQPVTKSTNLLQLHCLPSVRIGVNYPLFPFNGCLSVIDYSVVRIRKLCSYYWCDKTNFYDFYEF